MRKRVRRGGLEKFSVYSFQLAIAGRWLRATGYWFRIANVSSRRVRTRARPMASMDSKRGGDTFCPVTARRMRPRKGPGLPLAVLRSPISRSPRPISSSA